MVTSPANRLGSGKSGALWIILPVLAVLLAWPPMRSLMGQVALALLLAGLCLPLQRKLEMRMKQKTAALISILSVLCLLAGLILLAVPQIIRRITDLVVQIPQLMGAAENLWKQISRAEWFRTLQLDSNLPGEWLKSAGNFAAAEIPRLITRLAGGIQWISRAFLAPVLSYYFLRDRAYFCYQASLLIPVRYRKECLKMLREMKRELLNFLRGQAMVSLAVMCLTALGLFVLGIPSWLALGIVMGLCEMIPYIGPLIGGLPVLLFSLPLGISKTVWALALVILVQQAEGYFLSPRLMAGAVALHPVYILLLLTAGGLAGGLAGMVAAVPLFVCLRGAMRVIYVGKQPEKIVKSSGNDKV